MSTFQLSLTIAFVIFITLAVLIFTGILPGFGGSARNFAGEIVLWGTISEDKLRPMTEQFNNDHRDEFTIKYVEKDTATFESELISALAAGSGPDIFMLPQDFIVRHSDKVFPIPYKSINERAFKDTFIEEGELYMAPDGIIALPFTVDPLVMYWNRDIFSGAGVARTPEYWDEFLTIAPLMTKKDTAGNITQATVAFGEFANVDHAKEILVTLVLQTGDKMAVRGSEGLEIAFGQSVDQADRPAESAVRFYAEFANPAQPVYSWNRSLPSSRDIFIAGDLGVYFGLASELSDIVTKNPHLNFDIAPMPQIRGNTARVTFGDMQAIAVAKNSAKTEAAFQVAYLLTGKDISDEIGKVFKLPPPRRDILAVKQTDSFNSVFYDSALMARGWLDPAPKETYAILKDMTEGISSGRFRVSEAVSQASAEMRRFTPFQGR